MLSLIQILYSLLKRSKISSQSKPQTPRVKTVRRLLAQPADRRDAGRSFGFRNSLRSFVAGRRRRSGIPRRPDKGGVIQMQNSGLITRENTKCCLKLWHPPALTLRRPAGPSRRVEARERQVFPRHPSRRVAAQRSSG